MEQVFLSLIAITLSAIIYIFGINLYRKNPKKIILPPAIAFAVTIIIFIVANIIGDWTGVFISLGGAVVGVGAILGSIALLIYYFMQKSQY